MGFVRKCTLSPGFIAIAIQARRNRLGHISANLLAEPLAAGALILALHLMRHVLCAHAHGMGTLRKARGAALLNRSRLFA